MSAGVEAIEGPVEPWFRVVRGDLDDEELAALTAVLIAATARHESAEPAPTSGWVTYWRTRRAGSPAPGGTGWRDSLR